MTDVTGVSVDPLQRRRWLATQADWIAASSRATDLGRRARRAYLDRTQIRNLQRVAETSASVSTLTDYIKTQTGKHPLWRRENFGPMLLDDLDRLQSRLDGGAHGGADAHGDLCRLYVRQLAASYAYSIAVDSAAPRPAAPAARPSAPTRDAVRPPRQRGPRGAPPRPEQTAEDEASGVAASSEAAIPETDVATAEAPEQAVDAPEREMPAKEVQLEATDQPVEQALAVPPPDADVPPVGQNSTDDPPETQATQQEEAR